MHLARSPLVLVLVQVRFPKRLFQEAELEGFRKECDALGYPLFHEGLFQAFGIGGNGEERTKRSRWDLLDRFKCWNIVLTQDFLLLQTTKYVGFADFLDRWRAILDAAHRELGVALIERLGLRYVDLVQPSPGERISDYVDSGFAGYEPGRGSIFTREQHVAATVLRSDKGQMLVRVLPALSHFPPDMDSLHLNGLREPTPGAVFLDFDHSSTDVLDFDPALVATATTGLHDAHDQLFQTITTSHAMTVWGREDSP